MISKGHQDFLVSLCERFDKKSFSLEEAKQYFFDIENYTELDFSYYWLKSFSEDYERSYIARDGDNFCMLHKALILVPKREKMPWTHAEIISIVSLIATSLVALTASILGAIY